MYTPCDIERLYIYNVCGVLLCVAVRIAVWTDRNDSIYTMCVACCSVLQYASLCERDMTLYIQCAWCVAVCCSTHLYVKEK